MIEIFSQKTADGHFVPHSPEDKEKASEFKENQIVRMKLYGVQKERSYLQLQMLMAVLGKVAENTENQNWNTKDKAKLSLKVALNYVDDGVLIVDKQGNIHVQYRSFSYKDLRHMEACKLFDRAWPILADVIGVTVEELLENTDRPR